MLLLHTSDWHLGRSLHRADLREAQSAFLDSLVDAVRTEGVDVVLVSGDVYDRAVPPVDAVALCESALVRLREAGATVVAISGNHDSARRLGFGSALLAGSGVHLRTSVEASASPVVLSDRHGPVCLYGIPYLEPDAVRSVLPADPADPHADPPRGHAGVLGRALSCVRGDLAGRGAPRSVVLAHAWVGPGQASDSERDITVGGLASVPTSLFDGFSYGALGHLHGPQTIADGLRYSGSPLAYSFSESGHRKGSWLVELGASGVVRVEQLPAPVPRALSTVRGPLAELLTSSRFGAHERDWLTVVYTDPARPDDAMERLSRRFPHILVLRHEPEGVVPDGLTYGARVAGRSDLEVGEAFVAHVRGSATEPPERELLRQALEAGRLTAAGA